MNHIIERVARALAATAQNDSRPVDQTWKYYEHQALVAINAMREPSRALVTAAADRVAAAQGTSERELESERASVREIIAWAWPIMIDEALR